MNSQKQSPDFDHILQNVNNLNGDKKYKMQDRTTKNKKRKGNIDQASIDNPPIKDHKAAIITEFLMLSD
jgi:hypothetical protein